MISASIVTRSPGTSGNLFGYQAFFLINAGLVMALMVEVSFTSGATHLV